MLIGAMEICIKALPGCGREEDDGVEDTKAGFDNYMTPALADEHEVLIFFPTCTFSMYALQEATS